MNKFSLLKKESSFISLCCNGALVFLHVKRTSGTNIKTMALKYHSTFALLLLLVNLNFYGNVVAQKDKLGASFIFGDSLVDAGNNNYLSTFSKADVPPNGIDFKASGGSPTGRFTNGRTISDIVGNIFCHIYYKNSSYFPLLLVNKQLTLCFYHLISILFLAF